LLEFILDRTLYKLILILLISSISIISTFGQDRKFHQIEGKIKNTQYKALPFAHILIQNKRMGKISNYDGSFTLIAEAGDTIIFSSVGYKKGRYIVPMDAEEKILFHIQIMLTDTIELKEAIIFPWDTYEEFKQDFIEMEMQDDDVERAYRNLAMIEKQMILYGDELPVAPNAAHRIFMDENVYSKKYYAGQSQPMKILDVMAWSEFYKTLKFSAF